VSIAGQITLPRGPESIVPGQDLGVAARAGVVSNWSFRPMRNNKNCYKELGDTHRGGYTAKPPMPAWQWLGRGEVEREGSAATLPGVLRNCRPSWAEVEWMGGARVLPVPCRRYPLSKAELAK